MPHTIKVKPEKEKNEIIAESSDVLAGVREEKLIELAAYQVRTVIGLGQGSSAMAEEARLVLAEKAAQAEANVFAAKRIEQAESLVKQIKELVDKDKAGDGTAAAKAAELVKKTADEIEDTLPDFGKRIRKAVEAKIGKLPSGTKSVSSGGFKGIKLVAHFENAGAVGLKVEVKDPVKKWLTEKEPILFKNMTEELGKTGTETEGLEKTGNNYEIKCEKNPKCRIICQVKAPKLTMLAIYEIVDGKKELVAGEKVSSLES